VTILLLLLKRRQRRAAKMTKEIEMMRTRESDRLNSLLFGIGIGAGVALVAALLARKETLDLIRERSRSSRDYLRHQAAKLREAADEAARRAKDFVGSSGDSPKTDTEAENQTYQKDKRENMGG
jgi:gas vesicle protein